MSTHHIPSGKVLAKLPVGEKVGIAFSGGLDTSVAVAWKKVLLRLHVEPSIFELQVGLTSTPLRLDALSQELF